MQYSAKSKCMFHTSTNPCQNMDFLAHHHHIFPVKNPLIALSNLICPPKFLPRYSQPGKADYPKYRALSTVTTQSADQCSNRSNSTEPQRWGNMSGYGIVWQMSILLPWGVKFIHEMKTKKDMDKISIKDDIIFTVLCVIGPYKACKVCIQIAR